MNSFKAFLPLIWFAIKGKAQDYTTLGMVMVQAFNGAGDTKTPAFINVGVLWMIEIPLAYFLAITLNFRATGIFIAIAFCHSFHALVSWWFFRQGTWKKMKV